MKKLYSLKTFLFQKKYYVSLMWALLFLILMHCRPPPPFFFQFYILLAIFVIVLNATNSKCLTSVPVSHLLKTPCLFNLFSYKLRIFTCTIYKTNNNKYEKLHKTVDTTRHRTQLNYNHLQ